MHHWPVAITAHPASNIQKALAVPILLKIQRGSPAPKLLLLIERQFVEFFPRVTEAIGRAALHISRIVQHSRFSHYGVSDLPKGPEKIQIVNETIPMPTMITTMPIQRMAEIGSLRK